MKAALPQVLWIKEECKEYLYLIRKDSTHMSIGISYKA